MKVLVADDEPIERIVVMKKLRQFFGEELELLEAVNGREAVELFEKESCQIALLDIEMPGINGLEAAEKIRKTKKPCEIIFLTAFDEFNYAKKAISVKALDYLLKPAVEEELIACMEEAIALAKSRKNQETVLQQTALSDELLDGEKLDNLKLKKIAELLKMYLHEHYDQDIALQDVANHFHYSDAYFCKVFKQCFDKSFIIYLSEFRVEKAKELLADVSVNVKDISQKVGYRDSNYFAKVFKRITGVTPSEYRLTLLKEERT